MENSAFEDSLEQRLVIAREVLRFGNPETFLNQAEELDGFNVNLLYGYVQSFVELAYRGDVHKTAARLSTTRQSVKRHIIELENLLDVKLFEQIGISSKLTSMGILWLPRAQEIFDLSGAFLRRRGNAKARYQSTQLPLRMLLNDPDNSQLLRQFALAWMQGDQTLDGQCYSQFKSHCILYERQAGHWRSREIGENSAFCLWYGKEVAHQSQGLPLAEMETGADLGDEVSLLLDAVYTRGGLHFSEAACSLLDSRLEKRQPAFYQRLLAELVDLDGRPVVASIIEVTDPLRTDPTPY